MHNIVIRIEPMAGYYYGWLLHTQNGEIYSASSSEREKVILKLLTYARLEGYIK